MMFEIYQLRYFVAVVETGNFTRAAHRLNVTQPSLSVGIRKLEERVGGKLLQRTSRRVFLTGAGTRFVSQAKEILALCDQAALDVRESTEPSVLRLGVLQTIPADAISGWLGDARRRLPGLTLELQEGTEHEIGNRLDDGAIDLAITVDRPDRMSENNTILLDESYVLVLARDHPLATRSSVPPEALASENTIVRTRCEVLSNISRFFTDRNIRPRHVYRTEHDERALAMVAAGIGYTIVPESYNHPGIKKLNIHGFDLKRTLVAIPNTRDQGTQSFDRAMELSELARRHSWTNSTESGLVTY